MCTAEFSGLDCLNSLNRNKADKKHLVINFSKLFIISSQTLLLTFNTHKLRCNWKLSQCWDVSSVLQIPVSRELKNETVKSYKELKQKRSGPDTTNREWLSDAPWLEEQLLFNHDTWLSLPQLLPLLQAFAQSQSAPGLVFCTVLLTNCVMPSCVSLRNAEKGIFQRSDVVPWTFSVIPGSTSDGSFLK